ncbi:hypothetical protein [Azospirillum doebereinerae]
MVIGAAEPFAEIGHLSIDPCSPRGRCPEAGGAVVITVVSHPNNPGKRPFVQRLPAVSGKS